MRIWSERMGWRWRLAKLHRAWAGRPPYDLQTLRLAVLASLLTTVYMRAGRGDGVESICLLVAMPLWLVAIRRAMFARWSVRPVRAVTRWAVGVAVAVTLLFTFGHDECPHGTYLWIGPCLVQTSGPGCGNPRHFHTFLSGRDPSVAPATWPE
jgi:hypothetical protein